jgi:hypothetical protein
VKREVREGKILPRKQGSTVEGTTGGAKEREKGRWYARMGRRCEMTSSTMLAAFVWKGTPTVSRAGEDEMGNVGCVRVCVS